MSDSLTDTSAESATGRAGDRDIEAEGVASNLFEMCMLKNARRTGWWIAGVKDPESIAEHSFRASVLATVLAAMEGADPARAAQLAIFHDTQETRIGDIPYIGRRYLKVATNQAVTADQVAACPPAVARVPAGHRGHLRGPGHPRSTRGARR